MNTVEKKQIAEEKKNIRSVRKNKKGHFISIKCWTPSCGSSIESHFATMSEAIKFLRHFSKNHANFKMSMETEHDKQGQESLGESLRETVLETIEKAQRKGGLLHHGQA